MSILQDGEFLGDGDFAHCVVREPLLFTLALFESNFRPIFQEPPVEGSSALEMGGRKLQRRAEL